MLHLYILHNLLFTLNFLSSLQLQTKNLLMSSRTFSIMYLIFPPTPRVTFFFINVSNLSSILYICFIFLCNFHYCEAFLFTNLLLRRSTIDCITFSTISPLSLFPIYLLLFFSYVSCPRCSSRQPSPAFPTPYKLLITYTSHLVIPYYLPISNFYTVPFTIFHYLNLIF